MERHVIELAPIGFAIDAGLRAYRRAYRFGTYRPAYRVDVYPLDRKRGLLVWIYKELDRLVAMGGHELLAVSVKPEPDGPFPLTVSLLVADQ